KPDDRWPSCTELVRTLKQAAQAATVHSILLPPMPAPGPPSPPPPAAPARDVPDSGIRTMPAGGGPALADSLQAPRMALGGENGGTDPPAAQARDRTPPPSLPPLIKPGPNTPGLHTPVPPTSTSSSNPRLITPGAAASNPVHTLSRPVVLQT